MHPIKTAVIGASGFIGRHLWQSYRQTHPDCLGTGYSASHPGLSLLDIRAPDIQPLRLEETGHRAVLIAAAKPNIGYCDQNQAAAYAVNVAGTLDLIRQVSRTSLQVIFLSSDYVFDGQPDPHPDDEPPRPTTEYGRQKVLVEKEIPALTNNFLILRLSKIFNIQKGDNTLLDEMASALAAGREVRAAHDQTFCPTHIDDLVRAIQGIQANTLRGVLNVASPERWSRYDIAASLAAAMRVNPALVQRIALHEIPAMAGRPLDTSMACGRLQHEVGATFRPFKDCIAQVAGNWR